MLTFCEKTFHTRTLIRTQESKNLTESVLNMILGYLLDALTTCHVLFPYRQTGFIYWERHNLLYINVTTAMLRRQAHGCSDITQESAWFYTAASTCIDRGRLDDSRTLWLLAKQLWYVWKYNLLYDNKEICMETNISIYFVVINGIMHSDLETESNPWIIQIVFIHNIHK